MFNPEENRSISIQRTPSTHVSHTTDHSKIEHPNDIDMTIIAVPEKQEGISAGPHIIPDIILTDTNKSCEQSLHYSGDIITGDFLQIPGSNITGHSVDHHQSAGSITSHSIIDHDISNAYASTTAVELEHEPSSNYDGSSRKPRSRDHSVTLSIETGNLSQHVRRRSGSLSPRHSLAIVNVDPSSPSTLHTLSNISTPVSPSSQFRAIGHDHASKRFQAFPGLGSFKSFVLALLAFLLVTLSVGFTIVYDFVLLGSGNNVYDS